MRRAIGTALLVVLLHMPLSAQQSLSPGAALPVFSEMTVGGHAVTNASVLGKPVVVWFSRFSQGEMDAAPQLFELCRGGQREVTFLVMSLNGPHDGKARAFAAQFKIPEMVAVDTDGSTVRQFTGAFVEGGVPLYNLYAFNAQGKMTGMYHFPGIPPRVLESELLRL